ncbi:MAG: DUF2079 domain-containing protein [Myxococcaceae bacterium]|nr:DUF2079 domain-containing protein [Myxococcaceae bacterium]
MPLVASASRLTPQRAYTAYVLAIGAALCLIAPLSWLHRELGAPRTWQTLLTPLLFLALAWTGGLKAGASEVRLSRRTLAFLSLSVLVYCLSVQLGRYFSFAINGVDFSIFDWMLFNSNHRSFGYSPIYDVNHFGVHANWVLFPLMPLHRLFETPLFLCTVTALAVGSAAWPLWRLGRRALAHDGLVALLVLAYLTNPFTSVLLDGGFRPEVLYPLFGFTFVLGWLERRPTLWVPALVAFLGIKEDAALYVVAFGVAALLFERERWKPALGMVVGAVVLFVFNVKYFQPLMLRGSGYVQPGYVSFWGQYGQTLPEILRNMAASPLRLVGDILTSGWYRLFAPALFLPLLAHRALVPMLPTLFLLGSASYGQMHDFRTYYPVTLLPFFFWGLVESYGVLARSPRYGAWREALLTAALLLFPLVGGGYAKLVQPPAGVRQALVGVSARLDGVAGPVCAQTALFPHLPYALPLRPLFDDCWERPEWPKLVHLQLDTYPYERSILAEHVQAAREAGSLEELGGGFVLLLPTTAQAPRAERGGGPFDSPAAVQ